MTIKKEKGNYYARFQLNGERHHFSCRGAKNIKEAQEMEMAFKYKIMQQQNGVIPRQEKGVKIKILYDNYLEYSKINKKTYRQDKGRIKIIKEFFPEDLTVDKILPKDLEEFKKFLLKRNLSKTTINLYIGILSKMFNLAIDNYLIKSSPIKRGVKFKNKNYSVRYITEEEEKRLLAFSPDYFKPIIITTLNTGLRKQNIIDLKWENINFEFKFIEILENKGNKHIKIPLNETMFMLLSSMEKESEYIFLNPITKEPYGTTVFGETWRAIRKKAGLDNIRFHDLRHTVGTRLAKQGVAVPVIKEILAHSDIKTTMRYIHSASADIMNAMNVLNSYN